jgi:hypothetical protein
VRAASLLTIRLAPLAAPAILAALLASASALAATQPVSPDGAWTYFTEPRAINYDGQHRRTYVGWLDSRGQIVVASYDHRSHVRTRAVLRTGERVDDHNNPSILARPDGRLLVFYSTDRRRHLVYRLTRRPEDITAWGHERRVPTNAPGDHGYTYPNPQWLSQERRPLYLFWRGGGFEPVWSTWRRGGDWSRARTLIDGNGQRPYVVYESNGKRRIQFAFVEGNPSETTTSVYYMAYERGQLKHASGTTIAPLRSGPIRPPQADLIHSSGATGVPSWAYDVGMGSDGRPVVVYATFPSATDHRYHYARWNGAAWVSHQITASGPAIYTGGDPYYAGGLVLDSRDPSVVYLSRHVAGVYQVERWKTPDGGITWRSRAITSGHAGNYRPVSARGPSFGKEHDLYWMRGRYNGWLDFGTAIHTRTKRPKHRANASFEIRRADKREFEFRGARADRRVWNFGDGTGPVRGREATHTYELPGRYRVTSVARGGRRDVYIRELDAR